jgi:hypothetical protein
MIHQRKRLEALCDHYPPFLWSTVLTIYVQLAVFLPLLFSRPSSHNFTKEGLLRQFIFGETEIDVYADCILTDEVSNPE